MYGPTTRTDVFALSQKGQQALIIHHEGHEDLVMAFEVSASAPLSSLAWIIPVPSVPDSYGTASPNLLGAVAKWTSLRRVVTHRMNVRAKGRGASPAAASPTSQALQVLPTAEAGPYAIQPLKATGNAGVAALGKWMKDNGFVPLEKEKLSYYVERNWTFLAVRIQPADGAKAISDKGLLPPLRMRFASARAVYPLKLSTHQGVFPVRVDIVTKEPLPKGAFKGAKKRGFEVAGAKGAVYQSAPGAAAGTLLSNVHAFDTAKAPAELRKELARVKLDGKLHVRTLYARAFGKGAAKPADWKEDLAVPAPADGERLEGKFKAPASKPAKTKPSAKGSPAPSAKASAAPTPPASRGGSSCHVASALGSPTGHQAWLLGLLAGMFALRRRRR